ncbi:transposase family protein [Streptomyces cellulosae]
MTELGPLWHERHQARLASRPRKPAIGAGTQHRLLLVDGLLATLVHLRHGPPHDVLACGFGADRSTITRAIGAVRPLLAERDSTPHGLPCTSSSGGFPRPPSPARWEGSSSPEPSPCMGRTARHSRLAAGCGGFSASIPVHVAHAVHETAAEARGLVDARDTGPAVHRFGVPRVIAGFVGLSAVVARPTLGSVLLGHRRLVHQITFCFLNLASPRPRCGAQHPPPARLRRTWRSRSPRPSVRKHWPGDRDVTGTTRSPGG